MLDILWLQNFDAEHDLYTMYFSLKCECALTLNFCKTYTCSRIIAIANAMPISYDFLTSQYVYDRFMRIETVCVCACAENELLDIMKCNDTFYENELLDIMIFYVGIEHGQSDLWS